MRRRAAKLRRLAFFRPDRYKPPDNLMTTTGMTSPATNTAPGRGPTDAGVRPAKQLLHLVFGGD